MVKEDWRIEAEELDEKKQKANDRAFSKAERPFLVESFCAQVAWMGKMCPVYPYTAGETKNVCKFLSEDGYEDYRCPVCVDVGQIYKPIFEEGTEEQRKALESLADMSVHYSQNPTDHENAVWLMVTRYDTLQDAMVIYEKLGLNEKLENARNVQEEINTKATSEYPLRTEGEKREREERQAELDRVNKKNLELVQRKLAEESRNGGSLK
tara:strand:- start:846 stop:1475 length:630 start_codon:yes stop_codon:yes gene_type:complete